MSRDKRKILLLVEGAKTDVRLMQHLIKMYEIDVKHEIVSYNTNIYTLYSEMFVKNSPEDMDILQVLKNREDDNEKKKIFNDRYTDILLIFDLDPHDSQFTYEKINKMMNYYTESTDMGKLYLNYPMVEAFYHMKDIPDEFYNTYCATLLELEQKKYKKRVNKENRDGSYNKFACTREECNKVIQQNIDKAWFILNRQYDKEQEILSQVEILSSQLNKMREDKEVYVLCTCAFFIVDYNSGLIKD